MRRFKVQFDRFLEVGEGLLLGTALAGDVEFEALGDVPLSLTPNGSRKWSLHSLIVSQVTVVRRLSFRRESQCPAPVYQLHSH